MQGLGSYFYANGTIAPVLFKKINEKEFIENDDWYSNAGRLD